MAGAQSVPSPASSLLVKPNLALQSNDTRNLLDVVDNLRSQGISRYIDLPEIIVCGEQSSGKSSVLEAISGVAFPSKDNLCTRFATELVLRRGPETPIKIRIVPGPAEERSDSEKEKLANYNVSVSAANLDLGSVIESAKEAMGINEITKVFSSDILRLEISGPEQPHLTLVDLPGLFQASSRSQSDADSETVKALVLSYMRRPRSIILAVVSAKNDFNNQSVTKYAREIDPEGKRTLGLITKPDTLDKGSDSENFYIELAQNKDVKFRLGWHVLRNRDYTSRDVSLHERNRAEEQFFSTGVWKLLSPTQLGIHALTLRLSRILTDQIILQLPDVLAQIQSGLEDCEERLSVLGASRATVQDQRRYLLHVSHEFSGLVKSATDGLYSDPFFGSASTEEGYQKRLRAVLQNILTDFTEEMRVKGHTFDVVDDANDVVEGCGQISRQDYISKVKLLLSRSRGRELAGLFDPLIIGELFREQCKPWAKLVNTYVDRVVHAVYHVVDTSLAHISDQSTLEGLSREFVHPKLEDLTSELRDKVKEILRPHEFGHPITYNHVLTDTVQKTQHTRRASEIKQSLEQLLGYDYSRSGDVKITLNVKTLIDKLVSKTDADMNNYASSTATDFMEAYYKVALEKVVDDISVLVVEARLIGQLPTLFSPETVLDVDDSMVSAVAAESEESLSERNRCQEKRTILQNGLKELKRFQEHRQVHFERSKASYNVVGNTSLGEVIPKEEVSVAHTEKAISPPLAPYKSTNAIPYEEPVNSHEELDVQKSVDEIWGAVTFPSPKKRRPIRHSIAGEYV